MRNILLKTALLGLLIIFGSKLMAQEEIPVGYWHAEYTVELENSVDKLGINLSDYLETGVADADEHIGDRHLISVHSLYRHSKPDTTTIYGSEKELEALKKILHPEIKWTKERRRFNEKTGGKFYEVSAEKLKIIGLLKLKIKNYLDNYEKNYKFNPFELSLIKSQTETLLGMENYGQELSPIIKLIEWIELATTTQVDQKRLERATLSRLAFSQLTGDISGLGSSGNEHARKTSEKLLTELANGDTLVANALRSMIRQDYSRAIGFLTENNHLEFPLMDTVADEIFRTMRLLGERLDAAHMTNDFDQTIESDFIYSVQNDLFYTTPEGLKFLEWLYKRENTFGFARVIIGEILHKQDIVIDLDQYKKDYLLSKRNITYKKPNLGIKYEPENERAYITTQEGSSHGIGIGTRMLNGINKVAMISGVKTGQLISPNRPRPIGLSCARALN